MFYHVKNIFCSYIETTENKYFATRYFSVQFDAFLPNKPNRKLGNCLIILLIATLSRY